MRRMLIDQHDPGRGLGEDIGPVELRPRRAERRLRHRATSWVDSLTLHPGYLDHPIKPIIPPNKNIQGGRSPPRAGTGVLSKNTFASIGTADGGRIAPTARRKIPRRRTDCQWRNA